jgi:hypothetical protein
MITPYFDQLIDDFGIWQHSDGEKPLIEEGYALDDAARGLLATLALKKFDEAEVLFKYLVNAEHKVGFYGFATEDHKYIRYPASEDATAQVAWAMGFSYSVGFHKEEAKALALKYATRAREFEHVRGYAYALLGALYVDKESAKALVNKIIKLFDNSSNEWFWPEPLMTYGNGIIAYVLLRYALIIGDDSKAEFGLKVLEFVQRKCEDNRVLGPIGNDGWLSKNAKTVPAFSQQPIDSAYMIWAWLAANQYFNNPQYYINSKQWLAWFKGQNILGKAMYDRDSLKAYDGIDKKGVNYHSGAESNICLLMSLYMIKNKNTL